MLIFVSKVKYVTNQMGLKAIRYSVLLTIHNKVVINPIGNEKRMEYRSSKKYKVILSTLSLKVRFM